MTVIEFIEKIENLAETKLIAASHALYLIYAEMHLCPLALVASKVHRY